MPLKAAALNSGSNGNCYWFSDGTDAVLIDAGLSCKETEKRMDRLGLSMEQIRAILITHEHSDHIFGLKGLQKKYGWTVYVSGPTANAIGEMNSEWKLFSAGEALEFGRLKVCAFPTRHDAADSHGFTISLGNTTAGIFTDLGKASREVRLNFAECRLVFLECNYEEVLLENGPYPKMLKDRIRGGHGHLSNRQAMELLRDYAHPDLSHVFLSHLSERNNTPEHALEWFRPWLNSISIEVASRVRESAIVELDEKPLREGIQLQLF